MGMVVRAVDVGSGNTKYIRRANGDDIECASFPSIAYRSSQPVPSWAGGERLRTLCVPVGPLFYEVGPDVNLVSDKTRATHLHDDYMDSPEYLALLRGALRLMEVPHIDLLVVGLPVHLVRPRRAALEKLMVGFHDVGDGKTVTVVKALTVAQPMGALVHYASLARKMKTIGKEVSLVIDPGARTFDWVVCKGMRMQNRQSQSICKGMSDVVKAVASDISMALSVPIYGLDLIDLALRTGKAPILFQKPYDLSRHMAVAEGVAAEAVSKVKEYVGDPEALQNIILVGGASFMYRKAVKAAFPRHRIDELKQPMFANVRGFQLAGQNHVLAAKESVPVPQAGADESP
jgi:plasmid segregation protein ParM